MTKCAVCDNDTVGHSKYCVIHRAAAHAAWVDNIQARVAEKEKREKHFSDVWHRAVAAGCAAGDACTPIPMGVAQHADPLDDSSPVTQQWVVEGGVYGFAWVTVRPGNCPFANWLKKNDIAKKTYGGGVAIHIHHYGQSMERKYAYARAISAVFRDAGFNSAAHNRMD